MVKLQQEEQQQDQEEEEGEGGVDANLLSFLAEEVTSSKGGI